MPNHVTNIVKTTRRALEALLNEQGEVDFAKLLPFPGEEMQDNTGGVFMDAETAAEALMSTPLNDEPLTAALQQLNRSRVDIKKMTDVSFEQMVVMLRNLRKHGYANSMAWARARWGTKWNAYGQSVDLGDADGVARFDTAWSCPVPVFEELSKRLPEDEIRVTFADEDLGSNCGEMVFKGGACVERNTAPRLSEMDAETRAFWRSFACLVRGVSESEVEESEEAMS